MIKPVIKLDGLALDLRQLERIPGHEGDDVICGGPGTDMIEGGPGHNTCLDGEIVNHCEG